MWTWGWSTGVSVQAYRVVDSPHQDAEKRVAGAEKLLLLRHEVLFLGFGFAGDGGGETGSSRCHV